MSFQATAELGDSKKMQTLHCSFQFIQPTDVTGKPVAVPQGGTIRLTVESVGTAELFAWMISPTQVKSGTITFYRRDMNSKLKTLEFTDAYCVGYQEIFDHSGAHPMLIELVLSARELKVNDSQFRNNWPNT